MAGEQRGSERRALARSAATSYASRALLLLSALLLTPYLFRTLGPAGFGTWSVAFTLATVAGLLETGFADGVVRAVAAQRADGRPDDLRRTLGGAVTLLAGLGVVAAAGAAAAAFLLADLAAAGAREDFRRGMLLLALAFLVRFPCAAYGAALIGHQRYDLFNLAAMATTAAAALGAVAAVEAGHGVLGVIAAQGAATAGGGLLHAILLARLRTGLPLRPALAGHGLLRPSSLTLAAESLNFAGQRLDVVLIAALRDAATAAPYAAALKLQSGVQAATLPFVELLMPMASDLWARGRREELLRRLTLATRVAMQLTLPLAAGVALFATDIVDLWLGGGAPASTAWIVVLLMAVQVAGLVAAPARRVLVGVGRVGTIALLSAVEGIASVVLTVVLVSAYGAVGAAAATLVAVGAVAPLTYPLACRALGGSAGAFVRAALLLPLAVTVPALAAMGLVRLLLPEGAVRLAAGAAAGLALAGVPLARLLVPLVRRPGRGSGEALASSLRAPEAPPNPG